MQAGPFCVGSAEARDSAIESLGHRRRVLGCQTISCTRPCSMASLSKALKSVPAMSMTCEEDDDDDGTQRDPLINVPDRWTEVAPVRSPLDTYSVIESRRPPGPSAGRKLMGKRQARASRAALKVGRKGPGGVNGIFGVRSTCKGSSLPEGCIPVVYCSIKW